LCLGGIAIGSDDGITPQRVSPRGSFGSHSPQAQTGRGGRRDARTMH
jgi:hypothetical protein